MKKVLRKVPVALLVLVLVVSLFPVAALAAEGPSVSLPASVAVTGEDLPDPGEVYKLCLTARNGAPMPEGTVDGACVISVTGEGKASFPAITYGRVGVYEYTISQFAGDHPRAHYDATVYNVIVTVTNGPSGTLEVVTAIKNGSAKQESAHFVNTYDPERKDVTVTKVWEGSSTHPSSVRVSLVVGGETVDTVTLNKDNNWTHTWENLVLKRDNSWKVKEKTVAGKFVPSYHYDYKSSSAKVVNTYTSDLIQTGQLNWPIPVLLSLGAVLMVLGFWVIFKKREDERA